MENDFDTRIKVDIPQEFSDQKSWSALIIWPALVITIFIFVIFMTPSKNNQRDNINIETAIKRIVKIFNPNRRTTRIHPVSPKARIATIKSAIDTYLLNTQQYPRTLNDLIVDPKITGWAGPYLKKQSQLNDPWGNPFVYVPNSAANHGYDLISYGADGKHGGKDNNADVIYDY